jgi:hypothetical protein
MTARLRALALELRQLPTVLPAEVARIAAPLVAEHAKAEYPAEHVRTGATRDSIEAVASGSTVIVKETTPYSGYVRGTLTTDYAGPVNEAVRKAAAS